METTLDASKYLYDTSLPLSIRLSGLKGQQVSPDSYQALLNALYKDTFADPEYVQKQRSEARAASLYPDAPFAAGGVGDPAYETEQAQDWEKYVQEKLNSLGISQAQIATPALSNNPDIVSRPEQKEPVAPAPTAPEQPFQDALNDFISNEKELTVEQPFDDTLNDFISNEKELETVTPEPETPEPESLQPEQPFQDALNDFISNEKEIASIYPAGMSQKELYDALNYGKGLDPIKYKEQLIDVQKEWIRRQQGGQPRAEEAPVTEEETLVAATYPSDPKWMREIDKLYKETKNKPYRPGDPKPGRGMGDIWPRAELEQEKRFDTAIAAARKGSDEKRQMETFQSEFDPQKARSAAQAASNYRVGGGNSDPFRNTAFG